jgi:SAM-dependent methyltransferase
MSNTKPSEVDVSADALHDWLSTPLGSYLLTQERAYLDEAVADIFGFNALQLGLPQIDFLHASRIPYKYSIASSGAATMLARFDALPVESQSIDLLILPHVLEFADNPHEILREVDRVMMPEGRVIILGFNPWSLWGAKRAMTYREKELPWRGPFVSLVRLKDWLALLGFDVSAGKLACYVPPCKTEKWLERFAFMEAAGDRWWGIAGGVYMLQAIKRVHGMRLITPNWRNKQERAPNLAPVQGISGARHDPARSHLTLIK